MCPFFEKARRQLVRSYRGMRCHADALRELDRAAALNHRNNRLGVWCVEGHAEDAIALEALADLDAYLGRHLRDARALAWKGETLAQMGRSTEALSALERATRLDLTYGRAWAWLGRVLLQFDDAAGAERTLTRALNERRIEYSWISAWRAELARADLSAACRHFDARHLGSPVKAGLPGGRAR